MPITFSMNHEDGYLEIKYKGPISDAEFLNDYKSFFNINGGTPATNDLTDLSESDLSNLSSDAIRNLSNYISRLYKETRATSLKTAIYAPDPLQYGLSRMYKAGIYGTTQNIEIFEDREKAIQWLKTGK